MKKIRLLCFVFLITALINTVCIMADEYDYDFTYETITPSKSYEKDGRTIYIETINDNTTRYSLYFIDESSDDQFNIWNVLPNAFANDEKLYFVERNPQNDAENMLTCFHFDSGEFEQIYEDDMFRPTAMNGKYFFYFQKKGSGFNTYTLYRYNLKNGKKKEIIDGVNAMKHAGKKYLVYTSPEEYFNYPIYIMNRSGSKIKKIADGVAARFVDGRVEYLQQTDEIDNNIIYSCDYDGNDVQIVVDEFSWPNVPEEYFSHGTLDLIN